VLLADDLIQSDKPVLAQMVKEFDRLRASMAAVIEVDQAETSKYGILDVEEEVDGIARIRGLVEKPAPEDAPSNLAIIGRYILMPQIFDILGNKKVGAGNEIQLTDAMATLLDEQPIFGYRFQGQRFDCGDKAGFQMANLSMALANDELREQMLSFIKKIIPT